MNLSQKHCKPCEVGAPPLSSAEIQELSKGIEDWVIEEDRKLKKTFVFKDFKEALKFVTEVGKIAKSEGHHPDICIFDYKKVGIELFTHAIDGLSENDFILATKIDELQKKSILE